MRWVYHGHSGSHLLEAQRQTSLAGKIAEGRERGREPREGVGFDDPRDHFRSGWIQAAGVSRMPCNGGNNTGTKAKRHREGWIRSGRRAGGRAGGQVDGSDRRREGRKQQPDGFTTVVTAPSLSKAQREGQQVPLTSGVAEGRGMRVAAQRGVSGLIAGSHGCNIQRDGGGAARDDGSHQPNQNPEQWYCCWLGAGVSVC